MASGRDHDRATSLWALPMAGLLAMLLGGWAGALGGLAFLMGGLWLSPDLDTTPAPSIAGAHCAGSGGPTGVCFPTVRSSPMGL